MKTHPDSVRATFSPTMYTVKLPTIHYPLLHFARRCLTKASCILFTAYSHHMVYETSQHFDQH